MSGGGLRPPDGRYRVAAGQIERGTFRIPFVNLFQARDPYVDGTGSEVTGRLLRLR